MFKDRYDAAEKLAEKLDNYKNTKSVILAIPRGGLEIGFKISEKLNLPLDIVLTKKIGHPDNSEYAIGAVSLHGKYLADLDTEVSKEYIEKETKNLMKLLKQRYKMYRGKKKPLSLKGKNVIIVDDGMATGSTVLVAIDTIKENNPKKIIVAVPVSSSDAMKKVNEKADEVISLEIDPYFMAVGQYYKKFEQVSDEEAIKLLKTRTKR